MLLNETAPVINFLCVDLSFTLAMFITVGDRDCSFKMFSILIRPTLNKRILYRVHN